MTDNLCIKLFDMNREDVLKERKDARVTTACYTLLENEKSGVFPEADFILKYSEKDELVVLAERVWKSDYSAISWFFVLIQLLFYSFRADVGDDKRVSISLGKGYFDVIIYRGWWFDWIREQLL